MPQKNTILLNWATSRKVGLFWLSLATIVVPCDISFAQNIGKAKPVNVVINSPEDGELKADDKLTLREAIALTNGVLAIDKLSSLERKQVQVLNSGTSQIRFNLPPQSTTIYLKKILPELQSPGLIIDGTSQPGYKLPVVAIAPAPNVEIPRGLTVLADRVTIKGLSLYGFAGKSQTASAILAADIFIGDRLPTTANASTNLPPKNVVITDNWLGIKPDKTVPDNRSDFGIYVFNSWGTKIENNIILEHQGSGIFTSLRAENLQINRNRIAGNGLSGMADGIRLEGAIANTQISDNTISNNAGSGIYLFKVEGSVEIRRNYINNNGKRLKKAAIYLTGNNHKVFQNVITNQPAAGVVVASYPRSSGNLIQNNRFANLAGLSIDLNTQDNVGVRDWQEGDGANPQRNSRNRRIDTGNGAVNAPKFLATEFYILDGKVNLDGIADAGTTVEVYLTKGDRPDYNPLHKLLKLVKVNKEGRFSIAVGNLKAGDRLSAIAIDSKYGTSEPAPDVVVRSP